jgi:hypothetical protein
MPPVNQTSTAKLTRVLIGDPLEGREGLFKHWIAWEYHTEPIIGAAGEIIEVIERLRPGLVRAQIILRREGKPEILLLQSHFQE